MPSALLSQVETKGWAGWSYFNNKPILEIAMPFPAVYFSGLRQGSAPL